MGGQQIDYEAEGLLDGLDGDAREERLALLRTLSDRGVPVAELKRTNDTGTLMYLLSDSVIVGPERFTAAEVSERTGVDEAFLVAARRAMGLPVPERDEAIYTDAELEAVRMINVAREAGITDEDQLDLLRVLGRSLSQVAESLRVLPLKLSIEPGISELELAQRYAASAAALYPLVNPLVGSLLALYLRQATQSTVVSEMERVGGRLPGSREVSVCFADLVGFTRLGEEVPAEELGHLAVRLEALATEIVQPPVRLVKTIGDAAMLASPEPEPLIGAALDMIDAADAEGESFPQLRAGAAKGEALLRAGDWYGRPVNLASRITSVARPGSVLVARDLRDGAQETATSADYRWSFAGERRLKGVREPVQLFRVRRGGPGEP
jgi:adenylate cyclase